MLPEGLALYERLTAREFVRFVGAMYGLTPATPHSALTSCSP